MFTCSKAPLHHSRIYFWINMLAPTLLLNCCWSFHSLPVPQRQAWRTKLATVFRQSPHLYRQDLNCAELLLRSFFIHPPSWGNLHKSVTGLGSLWLSVTFSSVKSRALTWCFWAAASQSILNTHISSTWMTEAKGRMFRLEQDYRDPTAS